MAKAPRAAIPATSWLPIAIAFAPLDGWKVAGLVVDEVPAVVAVVVRDPVPAAEPLAAGVVVLRLTGKGATGAGAAVVTGGGAALVAGVDGTTAGVLALLVATEVELELLELELELEPEPGVSTHWVAFRYTCEQTEPMSAL